MSENGKKTAGRAVQFAAFDALSGYDVIIKDAENKAKRSEMPELSDWQAARLSNKLSALKKGMTVEIIYFEYGEYLKKSGIISSVDPIIKKIKIEKTEYRFENICDIGIKNK